MLVCVFAPFIMIGLAFLIVPSGLQVLRHTSGLDWIWFILLGAMMLGFYYFLVVYLEDEESINEEFLRLDGDHDGYISRENASGWPELARSFDTFDRDHDGRLTRLEFENFERALPAHA